MQTSTATDTDIWTTRASMHTARHRLGTAEASNGKIYAIGGDKGQWPYGLDTVEEYDPITDAWTTRTSMPTPRANMGVVAASNGKIYAIGGYDGNALDIVEEYDPTTDTWVTRASMPTARSGMGVMAASNGKIYTIGGSDGSGFVATVEEYDPTTDTWTTRASMPTARFELGAAEASNGKIYAVGGWERGGASYFRGIDIVEEYDPATDTWTTRASMPTKRHGLGVVSASNGKIYAIGGGDKINFGGYTVYVEYQAVEEFDPATDTWTTRTDMPTARTKLGVVSASNGKIYAIGGVDQNYYTSDTYFDTVEEYILPADVPPSVTKSVMPTGQVNYGDPLTYTLVISATPGTQVGLYDPLTDTNFLRFVEQPPGITHSNGVVTGSLTVTPPNQMTVSFAVQIGVPSTAGWTVDVTNRACVYPVGETLNDCAWSNAVTNSAFRPYSIYLPVVLCND